MDPVRTGTTHGASRRATRHECLRDERRVDLELVETRTFT
jgi:hypothetical protein